ncbi:MAG: hypothetical protein ABEH38_10285 [Flavobacteriales bacterium]
MSRSSAATDALKERIEMLIRYAERLRSEKELAEEKNAELTRTIEEKEERIGELERKVEELGRPGVGSSPPQKQEAEKRIEGMIREIDRCISLLER